MRIAFYAPMKAPDHPVPSGDRAMARAFLEALRRAGHETSVASRFRSHDRVGNPLRQRRLAAIGAGLAGRFVARHRSAPLRPELWFTYHLYHKAPDWLGPSVSAALGIPYIVAEASSGAKQVNGPWAEGHRASVAALRSADGVLGLNPADAPGIASLLADPARLVPLSPFLDAADARRVAASGPDRTELAGIFGLDPSVPWLVASAMMRADQKLASYRCLSEALRRLPDRPWHLIVAGDGPARAEVVAAFAPIRERVTLLGAVARDTLLPVVAACDVAVWPAIKESWGMALLEAQCLGVPVVAGRSGGVPTIVEHEISGLLATEGDADAFGSALAGLLDDPGRRAAMGRTAAERAERFHGIDAASRRIDRVLRRAVVSRSLEPVPA